MTKRPNLDFVFKIPRSCNGCTACCSGALSANIHGLRMSRGTPCHFRQEGGCAIYENRPQLCKDFRCTWLDNRAMPEWMWPKKSNVIVMYRRVDDLPYYSVVETEEKMSAQTLSWLVQWALRCKLNLVYCVEGTTEIIGSEEFKQAFANKKKPKKETNESNTGVQPAGGVDGAPASN